jgi:ribosomal protein L34E
MTVPSLVVNSLNDPSRPSMCFVVLCAPKRTRFVVVPSCSTRRFTLRAQTLYSRCVPTGTPLNGVNEMRTPALIVSVVPTCRAWPTMPSPDAVKAVEPRPEPDVDVLRPVCKKLFSNFMTDCGEPSTTPGQVAAPGHT